MARAAFPLAVASLLLAGMAVAVAAALLRREIVASRPARALMAAFAAVPAVLTDALSQARRRAAGAADAPKSDEQMAAEWGWASQR